MIDPPDGVVLVDKPRGPTSHDVVAAARRALGGVRAGHTGTLDPQATGLLVLVLGRATRLARYLPHHPKAYRGELVLGVTTTTDDTTGEPTSTHAGALPRPEDVAAAARDLTGLQEQIPPSVSAKRVGGTRLYRLARRGRPASAPPVPVTVERFAVAPTADPRTWRYELIVSAGTYVRACVRDLGARLGCGAAVATLRRTAIGPWTTADAMRWPDAPSALAGALRERIVGIDALPLAPRALRLPDERTVARFASGAAVTCPDPEPSEGTEFVVRGAAGGLVGIGVVQTGVLRPRVVLWDARSDADTRIAGRSTV
jgi:tRNA pseudouridine55 synthase